MATSVLVLLAVAHPGSANAANGDGSPSNAEPCRIDVVVDREAGVEILQLTRDAAEKWNRHTAKLPFPYELHAQQGSVALKGSALRTDGDFGVLAVNTTRFKALVTGYSKPFVSTLAGMAGPSVGGVVLHKSAPVKGRAHQVNVIAHELGHMLGVSHDHHPGLLMSTRVNSGELELSKRAVAELTRMAGQARYRYC